MELLVALGIFAISAGLIVDLSLTAARHQARTTAMIRAQGDAQLVLEAIARELRDGTIDVAGGVPADTLAIQDAAGASVWFRRATSGCPAKSPACILLERPSADGSTARASLTGAGVDARAFHFRSAPAGDPFTWVEGKGYAADEQPRVTVSLTFTASGGRPGADATVEAQTTVASRVYRR